MAEYQKSTSPKKYEKTEQNQYNTKPENGERPRRQNPSADKFLGTEKGERPRRQSHSADKFSDVLTGGKPRGAAGALIDLDKDLMKLLVRRATLVARIRGGKDHASTPQAILEEKSVRMAWEENALGFSKDPKFARELFSMLQDIKVLSKEEADAKSSFSLSPRKAPLQALITAPLQSQIVQFWIALAAKAGQSTSLSSVPFTPEILDAAKALKGLGCDINWENTGTGLGSLQVKAGKAISLAGKTVYLGNSTFSLYLLCFMAAGNVGVTRLTGSAELKGADLSPLRNLLPLLGTRLANTMPRSTGLPASLEASGIIPEQLVVPEYTPASMVAALLVSTLFWQRPITIDLSLLEEETRCAALSFALPLLEEMNIKAKTTQTSFALEDCQVTLPTQPVPYLDPLLCAYLLSMPVFVGGKMTLKGKWPAHLPLAKQTEELLRSVGLELKECPEGVFSENRTLIFQNPLNTNVHKSLRPLCTALLFKKQESSALPLNFEQAEYHNIIEEIASRLGLVCENGIVSKAVNPEQAPEKNTKPWTAPNASWGMAFALTAFVCQGISLANPGVITEKSTTFWPVFNSLPNPIDPAFPPRNAKEQADEPEDKPARRRIIAE